MEKIKSVKQLGNLTDECAFCGEVIERNEFNACEDCFESATSEPEVFISKVLA